VPNVKVGLVIGRAGSTIRTIQEKTGAHIQIPQEGDGPDPNTRIVSINASTQEAAQAALDEIRNVVEGAERRPERAPPVVVYVHVPQEKIGLIIGRGGANIKDLQNRTQTRIQIPPEAEPGSNPPSRLVSISGNGDAPERVSVCHNVVGVIGPTCKRIDSCQCFESCQAKYEIENLVSQDRGPGGGGGGGDRGGSYHGGGGPPGGGYGDYGAQPYGGGHYAGYYNQGHAPYSYGGYGYDPSYAAYYQGAYAQQPPPPGDGNSAGHPPAPPADGTSAPPPAPANGTADAGGNTAGDVDKKPQETPNDVSASSQQGQGGGGGDAAAGASGDPTAYYQQFWEYAAYYGEDAARQAWGAWAPPVGTAPPPGYKPPDATTQAPAPAPANE